VFEHFSACAQRFGSTGGLLKWIINKKDWGRVDKVLYHSFYGLPFEYFSESKRAATYLYIREQDLA
jgi:hypothetical protein